MTERNTCAFCEEQAELRESHVLPAFVYRWLRGRGGVGHIRNSESPNRRVQDGLKLKWLCSACEGRFSRFETAFATKVFYPWIDGNHRIAYDDMLLKFCVSISWRVLKFAYGYNKDATYSTEQRDAIAKAAARWKRFLLDQEPHPAQFEQHMLIFDIAEESTVPDLPVNFNRYMTGAITLDIVGSTRSMMTFAKLGRFIIFGMIQKGPGTWDGTKIHVKHGLLKPGKITVPAGIADLLRDKANYAISAMSSISPAQKAKIDANFRNNIDAYTGSDHFRAMQADFEMFGGNAFLMDHPAHQAAPPKPAHPAASERSPD
jgi:hypothetical protein